MLETKNFSNLTHRQSLGWHGAPLGSGRQHAVAGRLPSDHAAKPFKSRWLASELVAALRRNHRLASIGMPGCFASERANIQAQIINLMVELQERLGLTYLFIAHDLAVVRHVCDRIVVLYLGRVMEVARAATLFERPLHPYTRTLISAAPVPDPRVERARRHVPLRGEPPSAISPPSGCRFRTRCPIAEPRCTAEEPPLTPGADGQFVACHFPGKL
jgi:oligopeptide/dipeptide ABC transporter ATP-binding protein